MDCLLRALHALDLVTLRPVLASPRESILEPIYIYLVYSSVHRFDLYTIHLHPYTSTYYDIYINIVRMYIVYCIL